MLHAIPVSKLEKSGLIGLLGAALLGISCSKSDVGGQVSQGGSAAGGKAASQSGVGAASSGGSLSIGGSVSGPGSQQGGASDSGSEVDRDAACAKSADTVGALPSIVQLVVDTSGSMDWPPGWAPTTPDDSKPPGATKWEITRDALLAAVGALPADVALGTNFYPNIQQEGDTCLLDEVAAPIALLGESGSDVRAAWEAAVGDVVPVGATPTHGAYLFGLSQLAATKLVGNKFILLITDGTPTCTLACECTEDNEPVDSQPLIEEAAAALESGARTFVIGSPGSEQTRDVLSRLATVGGTGKQGCSDAGPSYCHFDMTTEADLAAGLTRALAEIATSLRSCSYPIPAPPRGQELDPNLVNVLYTPSTGVTETIARDTSSDCVEGWQYSADGQTLVLCGDTCDQVRADGEGTVEVLFGCATVAADPK